jgi:hypothetical protein
MMSKEAEEGDGAPWVIQISLTFRYRKTFG